MSEEHGILAMAHWRRLDCEGTDRCSLAHADNGWLLTGQARWGGAHPGELSYAVRCDENWLTLSADISGRVDGEKIALRIAREQHAWRVNDAEQPQLDGCTDIDLSFTPATNLMPVRRLAGNGPAALPARAAWLVPDLSGLAVLEQTYTLQDDGRVEYVSPNFRAPLEVHDCGFVTRYPGLWEGWVDA